MYGDIPQLKIPAEALTIGDCSAAGFDVTAWCDRRCNGRSLDLSTLGKWSGRGLLSLMREGAIVCRKCGRPAVAISVSSTARAERVLFWQIGDDAMPPTMSGSKSEKPAAP